MLRARIEPAIALRHRSVAWLLVLCCLLTGSSWLRAQSPESKVVDVYFADSLWPGDGPVIVDAALVVADGKVVAVGPRSEVSVPQTAIRHELGGLTLIPGLVVVQSSLVESARESDYTLTPEVRAVDGFDPFADFDKLLAAGVTTVQLSPGSGRLIPGQGAVVKLAGGKQLDKDPSRQILAAVESLRIILTRDALSPPTIYEPPVGAVSEDRPLEPTRPQLATSLAQAIVGLDALFTEALAGGEQAELAALKQLLVDGVKVRFTAENRAEVQAALKLAGKFDLKWLIVDPLETDLLESMDWKSEKACGVVLNADFRPGSITNPNVLPPGRKPLPQVWERAGALVKAGAGDKLALRPATDADLGNMYFLASSLARGGLSEVQILKMLTSNPARMLGVEDRVGRLSAGCDADFVVLTGRPFESGSRITATYADGLAVFEAESKPSASLISAGSVYTPDGVIVDGSVSVKGGKIVGVGKDLSLPSKARIKHFPGAVIAPGMIDCQTTLGVAGSLGDQLPLNTKLAELLARQDEQIAVARRGGVTTALLSSSRLPSPVIAFKFSDEPHALADPVALRFEASGNLTATEESLRGTLRGGKTYADAWTKYDADFAEYEKQLKEYEVAKAKYDAAVQAAAAKAEAEKKKAEADGKSKSTEQKGEAGVDKKEGEKKEGEKTDEAKPDAEKSKTDADAEKAKSAEDAKSDGGKSTGDAKLADTKTADGPKEPSKPTEPKKPNTSAGLEPYRDLFAKKITAIVELSDPRAVDLVLKLFREEFDIRTAIVAGQAAIEQASEIAKQDVMVIVGPSFVSEVDGELMNYAAELAVAGVPLAFQSSSSTGASVLPDAVSFAVFSGLGRRDALSALSHGPAEFFKLDSVGAIEVGRDADLVVWSGSPLEISSEVLAVMIDGKWVYEKESE